jgi:hypothetical protein
MEPAAALLMLESNTLKEAGVQVQIVVGDADSSTAAAVRNKFGDSIVRALDVTHAKKNLKNQLYNLQKVHKAVSKPVILYLTATVGTIINKCQGSASALAASLQNVPEHIFNKHDGCSPEWCKYYMDPQNYKSKYLAKSLGDHGCPLYKDLCACFDKLVRKSEELAIGGSTQSCESFNNTVSSKAPKNKHFGGTESLAYRVHAAVLQKNEGVDYTTQVCSEMSLSPGDIGKTYKRKLKLKRLRDSKRKSDPSFKARRKLNMSRRGQVKTRTTKD